MSIHAMLANSSTFWDFNVGHLLTIGGGLISLTVVWQKLRDKVDAIGFRMNQQENEMNELTKMGVLTTIQQHERRLQTLEITMTAVTALQTDVAWIKRWLNERNP